MIENLVSGQRVASNSGRQQDVFNPATGEVIDTLGLSSTAEVDAAIDAAHEALPAWANFRLLNVPGSCSSSMSY